MICKDCNHIWQPAKNEVVITDFEYLQFMDYIENDIAACKNKYSSLQQTKDDWNDRFNPAAGRSGLTIEEIEKLQQSLKERQHKLFIKWYNMNNSLEKAGKTHYIASKVRSMGSYLIGVSRPMDIIEKERKTK